MNPYADSDLDALMQGYLDGELDSAAEQRLFAALSTDPALQSEMRELRAIRSATIGSVHSFVPPAVLTSALFARLGMSSPVPAAEATTASASTSAPHTAAPLTSASTIPAATLRDAVSSIATTVPAASGWSLARMLTLLRVARIPLVVATAGAVLTTSVILLKDDPEASAPLPKDASVTASRSTERPTPSEDAPTEGKPSATAEDALATTPGSDAAGTAVEGRDVDGSDAAGTTVTGNDATHADATHADATHADATHADATHADATRTDVSQESGRAAAGRKDRASERDIRRERAADPHAAIPPANAEESVPVHQPGIIPSSTATPTPDASGVAALQIMEVPVTATAAPRMDTAVIAPIGMQPRSMGMRLPSGFTLAFTGLAKSSAPAIDLPSASDPFFNRMSVSVGYMLDASSLVGITFGQEAFPQRFDGREERHAVRYEQNLLTPWAAAWYRYTFGALLLEDLHPWAELRAGSTREFWPLMRGGVGLAYDLHPLLRLQVGVDLGVLGYRFQDRWFTTRHLGASYGLMFRF